MLINRKFIKIVKIIPKINVFSVYNKKYMTGPKKGDISDFAMQYKYVVFTVLTFDPNKN